MKAVTGCDGCSTTAGRLGCYIHNPPQKSQIEMLANMNGTCPWTPTGWHNWTPQIRLFDGSTAIRCLTCGREETWPVVVPVQEET